MPPLVGVNKRFDGISREKWETVIEVNTTGIFLTSKHALPQFSNRGECRQHLLVDGSHRNNRLPPLCDLESSPRRDDSRHGE